MSWLCKSEVKGREVAVMIRRFEMPYSTVTEVVREARQSSLTGLPLCRGGVGEAGQAHQPHFPGALIS